MLSNEQLKEIRKRAEIQTRDLLPITLAADVNALLDEIERMRTVHTREQRRSADRLRAIIKVVEHWERHDSAGDGWCYVAAKEIRDAIKKLDQPKLKLEVTPFGSQVGNG